MNFLIALPRILRRVSLGSRGAFIAATFLLVLGSMGGPLVVSAESRPGESQDNAPANERPEEFTTVNRCDHARQLKLERLRPAVTHKISSASRLGTTPTKSLRAPDGHRLSNGLLAPLTC
jgi:hypothetical protein